MSNDVDSQKVRIWRICRGEIMLKRITDATACSRQAFEDEDIITPSLVR